jgi:transposase-like protein
MTMSKRPRRNHSPVFKAKAAVDAIKGEKMLAELAKLHDVHPNQINRSTTGRTRRTSEPAARARPGVVVLFAQIDTPHVKTLNEIKKLREALGGSAT